jgi:S1-C subfamily serine protease
MSDWRITSAMSCICAATLAQAACAQEKPTSSGTGFLVNSDGWLVTNAHVVEGCARIKVSSLGDAIPRHVDVQNDLAAIQLSSPPAGVIGLAIRRAPPRLGEDVAALGYPLSDILSDSIKITTGNINSLVGVENDTRYLQISAPIQPGNSGGPLVDKAGDLLGITTATLGSKYAAETGVLPQNVNFAIRASVLEVFLQARNLAHQTVENARAPLATPDLAEQVSRSVFQILCFGQSAASASVLDSDTKPTAPSPGTQSAETRAASFVEMYHEAWSSDNLTALGFMRSAYGESVDFYGKTISKSALIDEKRRFAERWPIRSYAVRPETVLINCGATVCDIQGIVDWSVASPARGKTAEGAASFSMKWDSVLETISFENGQVVKASRGSPGPMALIIEWMDANGACRGGYPDDPKTEAGCRRREVISNRLDAAGWCYGKEGEFGYQMKWHRCTWNSLR